MVRTALVARWSLFVKIAEVPYGISCFGADLRGGP
jgi:hypothetical protein